MAKFNLEIDGKNKSTTKGNVDWYYGGGDEAWTDIASAKAGVPLAVRNGKTVGVLESNKIVEYIWHNDDLTDNGLVLKTASSSSSQVLNGTVNPVSGDGVNGDFWINTSANTLFGPKTAGAWGTGISLVGPQGAQGAVGAAGAQGIQGVAGADGAQGIQGVSGTDGKTILNGTVNPVAGDGVNGDFWINTSANTLFGPKTAGAWGTGISLVGPQGAQGAAGAVGAAGNDASATGERAILNASTLDWSLNAETFTKTLTAPLVLTDSNLPTSTTTKIIQLLLQGAFSVTLPTYYVWKGGVALGVNDRYVFNCINGTSGSERIEYTISPDL